MNSRIITDISNYIFVSDAPEKVDVIFLPGGSHPEQPEYAAKLYRKGYAKWLLPSGGVSVKREQWPGVRSKADRYNGNYQSDCEFFTDVLMKNGVPANAVIRENKSGHTRDNAFLSRKIVDEKGIKLKTALIVCKAFHARRCLMLYQMAFPDVEIKVCPIHCYNITRIIGIKANKVLTVCLANLPDAVTSLSGILRSICSEKAALIAWIH